MVWGERVGGTGGENGFRKTASFENKLFFSFIKAFRIIYEAQQLQYIIQIMYSLRSNDKTSFLDKENNIINKSNRIRVQNTGESKGGI